MANLWTRYEKWIVAFAILLTGYSVLASSFMALPQLPAMISNPLLGQISIKAIAGGLAVYGGLVLMVKY